MLAAEAARSREGKSYSDPPVVSTVSLEREQKCRYAGAATE